MTVEEYCEITEGGLVLREKLQTFTRYNLLSVCPTIIRQLDMLDRLGSANVPLFINGEKGCGKDRIAHYAHHVSGRDGKPFLKINCAYLPEGQTIIELFGSRGGCPGLLQQAQNGSLYLENIDMLSTQTQYQFLNHIQSDEGLQNDIRYMICLSAANATAEKGHGLIVPLLDYFNTATFIIPPLRERPEDILLLTMQQLTYVYEQYRVTRTVGPNVMSALLTYEWPGNIRQLVKVIDRMAFMSDSTLMDSVPLLQQCLSACNYSQKVNTHTEKPPQDKTLKELVSDYEIKVINQYIDRYGTLRKAAAALGVSHSVLSSKLSKYYAAPK